MRVGQIVWFNTWNKGHGPTCRIQEPYSRVYGSLEDLSDPTVDLFQRYWGGTAEWTRMGDQTVNKKILVIPTALFELPSLKVMRLINENEALRDQIYFWRFLIFRLLISSLYLIFIAS